MITLLSATTANVITLLVHGNPVVTVPLSLSLLAFGFADLIRQIIAYKKLTD
jgi:hypothetical protein